MKVKLAECEYNYGKQKRDWVRDLNSGQVCRGVGMWLIDWKMADKSDN